MSTAPTTSDARLAPDPVSVTNRFTATALPYPFPYGLFRPLNTLVDNCAEQPDAITPYHRTDIPTIVDIDGRSIHQALDDLETREKIIDIIIALLAGNDMMIHTPESPYIHPRTVLVSHIDTHPNHLWNYGTLRPITRDSSNLLLALGVFLDSRLAGQFEIPVEKLQHLDMRLTRQPDFPGEVVTGITPAELLNIDEFPVGYRMGLNIYVADTTDPRFGSAIIGIDERR